MAISAKDVKTLREMTGVGMMDCKAALTETDGDIDAAVKVLREKGKAKAAKKATRTATEGLIKANIAAGAVSGSLVEVSCNTDFVARNPDFIQIVDELSAKIMDENLADIDALKASAYRGATVAETMVEETAKIGENVAASRMVHYQKAETPGMVHAYIHPPGKIGVLIRLSLSDQALAANEAVKTMAQDICLHIAASSPQFVNADSVDASTLEAEKEIYKTQAMNEGKPEQIAEKIVLGRIRKFYEEVCLLDQPFVKDPDSKVSQLVEKTGKEASGEIKIVEFVRLAVGENAPAEEEG